MAVAARLVVKSKFPYAIIDFEIAYAPEGRWSQYWLVYDPVSGWLLSVGCKSTATAWKVASDNAEKVLAKLNQATIKRLTLP